MPTLLWTKSKLTKARRFTANDSIIIYLIALCFAILAYLAFFRGERTGARTST